MKETSDGKEVAIKVFQSRDCTECIFKEFETTDCGIAGVSGYADEEGRNYCSPEGYDAWEKCKFRLTWDDAEKILIWFIKTQKHEVA